MSTVTTQAAERAVNLAAAETAEKCALIAEALDSGRGNEREIARAIRNLAKQIPGVG